MKLLSDLFYDPSVGYIHDRILQCVLKNLSIKRNNNLGFLLTNNEIVIRLILRS